jgi:hypothetical protein
VAVDLPVTITEFRLRLGDFSEYFFAVIEDSSEAVIDTSDDQLVRRHAMEFRLRAVTVFLNALNKPDPVASLIDAWAFCLQIVDFLEEGGVFGEHQPLMIDAAHSIALEANRTVDAMTREDAVEGEQLVIQWVREHPLASEKMIRSSTTVLLADRLEAQDQSAFAALGRLQAGVDDIVAQFQRYISVMPRTVRWHSQLILHETLYDEFDLSRSMAVVDAIISDMDEISALADELLAILPSREELEAELNEAMASLEDAIEAERVRLLAEVDRQRGLIFDDVDLQREAIMRDIEAQLLLAQEQMQEQVDDIFMRFEALTDETVSRSFAESERLINVAFLRALILLMFALAGGGGLILLHKWRHPLNAGAARTADGPADQ